MTRPLPQSETQPADPAKPMVACEPGTGMKYILGPVEVPGTDISGSSFGQTRGQQGQTLNQWAVNIEFNGEGTQTFKAVTERLFGLSGARNQFAIVLDGQVISAPTTNAVIPDGKPQITGNFTEESARGLSEQLKYGALPISFEIQSEQQISATLGADQLRMGLIAGVIGLVLVAGYSIFQYRALGFVTIASLVVAGLITYLAIAILGWTENYRLSLAGVAGLIVAIGQTADSFIVYFERIRDELREGRGLVSAVDNGWKRARQTVLASKAVNLLAAVVLYFVAVGNVRGFAFTLGLTAVADLLVVFLFTHPTMVLLAKTRFFGEGHRFSGLDPRLLGAVPLYRGAGRVRQPGERTHAGPCQEHRGSCRSGPPPDHRRTTSGREATGDQRRRPRRQQGEQLMANFAKWGNDLYTGKRSYDFVGKYKVWFSIAVVAILLSIVVPFVKGGFNLGIDFRGGSEFTVSNVQNTEAGPGEAAVAKIASESDPRVTNIAPGTMRVQTERLSDDQTLQLRDALVGAYGVQANEVTSSYVGPTWGADVTRQALWGLVVFVVLAAFMMALYFRTWKMSVSALCGLAVVLLLTAGIYSLSDFEVTPSAIIGFLTDPGVLAVRHGGGLR